MLKRARPAIDSNGLLTLRQIAGRFGLSTLEPALAACDALASQADAILDVAVFGQFKSGKSSLLNAILGEDLLPVGAIPVTAIVTRVVAGPELSTRVTRIDGAVESVSPETIEDYISESRNPNNRLQVAIVDVVSPALADLLGLRLVDTPGLGSVFAHNTRSTRDWLPNVAVAIVVISADRPLADEDRRLIADLRPHAPRIMVVLSKIDLISPPDRDVVLEYMRSQLCAAASQDIPILPFSTREDSKRCIDQLKRTVLSPLAEDTAQQRSRTLRHKLSHARRAATEYLAVALRASEQTDADRQRLATAVLDESMNESVIRDELSLASCKLQRECRPKFEKLFLSHAAALTQSIQQSLAAEMSGWTGGLAERSERLRSWMRARFSAELTPIAEQAAPVATDLLAAAEMRFRRIAEAFQDRLRRNVTRELGIALSANAWQPIPPPRTRPPVSIGQTFMVHWELLSWLVPMGLVSNFFQRHCVGSVPREVETHLRRLASEWSESTSLAIADLERQASAGATQEIATLTAVLAQSPAQSQSIRDAISELENVADGVIHGDL